MIEYWIRIAISLHLCVKEALLEILHKSKKRLPQDKKELRKELQRFKKYVEDGRDETAQKLQSIIKSHQWEKMCPPNDETDSQDLDIPCIVILILNLKKIVLLNRRKLKGWITDFKSAISARELRNEINHCALKDVSTKKQFEHYWKRVEYILNGLKYSKMESFFELETIPLDEKTDLKITALNDQMDALRGDMQFTVEDTNRLGNIVNGLTTQINSLNASASQLKELQNNVKDLKESFENRLKQLEDKDEINDQQFKDHDQRIGDLEKTTQLKDRSAESTGKDLSDVNEKLSEEFQGTKKYLDEISTRVVDLEGNIPQMISNASEDTERKLREEVEERLKTHKKVHQYLKGISVSEDTDFQMPSETGPSHPVGQLSRSEQLHRCM